MYERPFSGSRKPQWQSSGTTLGVSVSKSVFSVSPLLSKSWLLPASSSGLFAFGSSTLVSFCPSTAPESNADTKSAFCSQDECMARTGITVARASPSPNCPLRYVHE